MASTVPQAKAALKALLEAHAWPVSTPEIRWGGPTEGEDFPQGGELIYFGDVDITDTNQTLGATRYDETYNLRVEIIVIQYGDDEQATEQRAWDLYWELLTVLDANRTLSGAVNRLTDRVVRQRNGPQLEQWVSRITVDQGVVGLVFL